MRILISFLLFLNVSVSIAAPETRLLLVGGGLRPVPAMRLFSSWAGGTNARILIIGWASTIPEDYFTSISNDLRAQGVTDFMGALAAPKSAAEKRQFIAQLNRATALFFSGGDQNRAMKVIDEWKLRAVLKEKFVSGIPFAGTSAGTAMMAEKMITGNSEPVIRTGLGLFKKPVIDMHFLIRNREARLLNAMSEAGLNYGVGVDEDGALAVINSSETKVLGEKHVVFFHRKVNGTVDRVEQGNGETFNVEQWNLGFSCSLQMFDSLSL